MTRAEIFAAGLAAADAAHLERTTVPTDPSQRASEVGVFGCTAAELRASVANAIARGTTRTMVALSFLSDAQEMLERGHAASARRTINCAKLVICEEGDRTHRLEQAAGALAGWFSTAPEEQADLEAQAAAATAGNVTHLEALVAGVEAAL